MAKPAQAPSEEVLKEYPAVGKYRVRLVRTRNGAFFDVREYISGESFEGFTRRGIRLAGPEEIRLLAEQLKQAEADWPKGNKAAK